MKVVSTCKYRYAMTEERVEGWWWWGCRWAWFMSGSDGWLVHYSIMDTPMASWITRQETTSDNKLSALNLLGLFLLQFGHIVFKDSFVTLFWRQFHHIVLKTVWSHWQFIVVVMFESLILLLQFCHIVFLYFWKSSIFVIVLSHCFLRQFIVVVMFESWVFLL